MVLMMSSSRFLLAGFIFAMLVLGKPFRDTQQGEHVNGATSESVVDMDGHERSNSIEDSNSDHIDFHDIGTKSSSGFETIEEKRLLEETTHLVNLMCDYHPPKSRPPKQNTINL